MPSPGKLLPESQACIDNDLVLYIFLCWRMQDCKPLKGTSLIRHSLQSTNSRSQPGKAFRSLYFGFFIVHFLSTQSMLNVVSPFGNLYLALQVAVHWLCVHLSVLAAGALPYAGQTPARKPNNSASNQNNNKIYRFQLMLQEDF
jgi:hypothetical protein